MPEYQLEIKQLVSYPRCRIYHELIQTLIADQGVPANGRPGFLLYRSMHHDAFAILC